MTEQSPKGRFPFFERLKVWLSTLRQNPLIAKALQVLSYVYPLALLIISRKEILRIQWQTFIPLFLICLLLYYTSMLLQCLNWSLLVDQNLKRLQFNSQVYFQTILMKRLPGGFWHWLGRNKLYNSEGNSETEKQLRQSNLYEWLILILTGFSSYLSTKHLWIGVLCILATILLSVYLLQRRHLGWKMVIWMGILSNMLYLLCWLIGAWVLFLLLENINPTAVSFSVSMAAWGLSGAFGMLFFFMPSGAIVRDLSLTALLSTYINPTQVALVALEIRIIFTLGEVLWSLFNLQIIKLLQKRKATLKA